MRIGQRIKHEGEFYKVYKIKGNKCYAEDEYGINIVCIPNLSRIK